MIPTKQKDFNQIVIIMLECLKEDAKLILTKDKLKRYDLYLHGLKEINKELK